MPRPLLLLLAHPGLVLVGQVSPHSARLLGAQVERDVLLALVEDAQLRALVGVDDGEHAGDGFADVVAGALLVSERLFLLAISYLRRMVWHLRGRVCDMRETVHLCQLRLRTTSDLLCPQLHQLLLQLIQLLPQLLLVLPPERGGLNLSR